MKPIRFAWCLAIAALVLGCDQTTEPAADAEAVDLPTFKAEHVDFIREHYYNDILVYPCLNDGQGEAVWERGRIVAYKGRVYQPSGNANRWTWSLEFIGLPPDDPHYNGPDYTLLGLESGDMWTVTAKSKLNARRHDKKDGFIYHQSWKLWLENQDGERVRTLDKYALHCDYDWNCSFEKVGGTCPTEYLGSGPPS